MFLSFNSHIFYSLSSTPIHYYTQTFILWFGWYGFNVGSTISITEPNNWTIASNVAINTTLSGAAGCVTTLFLSTIVTEHFTGEFTFNLQYAMNGCLSGLVSITAGCSVVESWVALIIGSVAGGLYLGCSKLLLKKRIDDAVDAIPVHVSCVCCGKEVSLCDDASSENFALFCIQTNR